MNESDIIEGLKKKNEEALYWLVDLYSNLIYGVIRSVLDNSHEESYIDQCYNDVMLTIWFNINKYDEKKGEFKNWLISVVKFKAIDFKRTSNKLYRNKELKDTDICSDTLIDNLINKENYTTLLKIINSLDEPDKSIFKQRFIEDLDVETICKNLNISKSNLYTRISRGKGKIRKIMEEENYEL